MTRRALIMAVLVVAALPAAFGAVGGAMRGSRVALAVDALPRIEHAQVCEASTAAGQGLHHAAVVIVFPDGTDSYCVSFEEDELSGAELLQRTDLPIVLSGFGGLGSGVCRIDNVGCSDPGNCFCQCQGADCHYWTYYELRGDAWRFLPVGASTRRAHDGDVDGWVWGNGHTPPGAASIAKLCAAVRPTPTPVPSTSVRSPTATPPPASGEEAGDVDVPIPGRQVVVLTVEPTEAATPETTGVSTAAPRVVRRSDRPSTGVAGAERDRTGDDGGGLPVGLIAFGVVAAGLAATAGGLVARRRLRG
jgi:hypothetical protein